MTDEEKIVEPEYEKDSLLDFSRGPVELESAKKSKSPDSKTSEEKAADIQARIKELDKIIGEAKQAEEGDEENIEFTPIDFASGEITTPIPEPIVEITQKPDDKPLQAWEVDSLGRPLKDKEKSGRDKTGYEIWLDEKREKEGVEINCPNCGTLNIDLPFVSGEKCTHCGFDFDKGENITKKMEAHDIKSGKKKTRVTELSPVNLKMSLDLPPELVKDPDVRFQCDYRSFSYIPYLLVGIGASIGSVIVLFGLLGETHYYSSFYFLVILVIVMWFAFHGLSKALSVTRVVLDHEGVNFHGHNTDVRFNYERITGITNKRQSNGRAMMMNSPRHRFFPFFFGRRGFYPFIYGRQYRFSYDYSDSVEFATLDTSSASPHFTNHITVTTNTHSVLWVFAGSDNKEFIRALAIVIFKARQANNNCLVDIPALKAAQKTISEYPDY